MHIKTFCLGFEMYKRIWFVGKGRGFTNSESWKSIYICSKQRQVAGIFILCNHLIITIPYQKSGVTGVLSGFVLLERLTESNIYIILGLRLRSRAGLSLKPFCVVSFISPAIILLQEGKNKKGNVLKEKRTKLFSPA